MHRYHLISPAVPGSYLRAVCICCLGIIACTSCLNFLVQDNHPDYFNPVFEQADATPAKYKEAAFIVMDSMFYAFPAAGIGDQYERFSRKRDFYYHIQKNITKGMLYNDSILLLLEKKVRIEKFAVLYAEALYIKGDLFLLLKNYNESFYYYVAAKQVMQQHVQDKCRLVGYKGRNARLFYTQGKYLLAAGAYIQCYKDQCECVRDDFLKFAALQESLDNTGMAYSNAGMPDSAAYFFSSTLQFIDSNSYKFPERSAYIQLAKAVVYGNQAALLGKKGMYNQAEALFTKSIQGTLAMDLPYTQATLTKFAAMYLSYGQQAKADSVLQQLAVLLDSLPNETWLIAFYKLKKEYYLQRNNPMQATVYLKKYVNLKDSADNRDRRFIALDVNSEFESREQKSINELLRKDNELKSVYIIVSVVASAMCAAILLLVWHNLRRAAKHVKNLEILNGQIYRKNEDLATAFISLEQSHKENSHIMRIVAHDLKNPVSAVNNMVYSLLKKEMPQSSRDVLELIKNACSSSLILIKDLLQDGARPAPPAKEMVDMQKLLEYCVRLLQAKADEKKQLLQLDATHVLIPLNRQKMWRVISNIINNAIKFSNRHTVIFVRLQQQQHSVLLSVQDEGIGIPAAIKDSIFSMLPGTGRAGTSGEESYGLGLSISRQIVEEHNGKLWFESDAGKGSVFYIQLPC